MNPFRADLHIHSRFSRATSTRLTVPHLAAWAGAKGINVLGTGDFTHPAWRNELREALEMDESGLLRMRQPLTTEDVAREIPPLAGLSLPEPLFMLQAEISSIYKKDGAVRKVHSLVYVPDFATADKLCQKLDRIGNLNSDGRPILGLDVKHLLDIVLELPGSFLVPAHIWTPWFSLFGSKSGFNSLEACFGDLTPHVGALETGLSSDPDMNRCWSHLDGLMLVSNSDAHSGENLGREATLFTGKPSYHGIYNALRGQNLASDCTYAGTLEFFPDEGKYHLDGHRACNVALEPGESQRLNNICPVCGKALTVGVLHRVLELSDRTAPPQPGKDFHSLIPLAEILGELLHCGPKTKKPQAKLAELSHRFGPELTLLLDTPLSEIGAYWPELGEALRRMRAGQVIRQGGYDGEYGVIRLFGADENQASLLPAARTRALPSADSDKAPVLRKAKGKASAVRNASASLLLQESMAEWQQAQSKPAANAHMKANSGNNSPAISLVPALSAAQQEAMTCGPVPVLVLAGPGSGKTRTLIGRVEYLRSQGIAACDILAVTFTRRAAEELRQRLAKLGDHDNAPNKILRENLPAVSLPVADTLHALALQHWPGPVPLILSGEAAKRAFATANADLDTKTAASMWDELELGRERMDVAPHLALASTAYALWKKEHGLADYADLLETWLARLQSGEAPHWAHVLVDEVQDLSPLQRALILALLPSDGAGFFGIGDPDQSIYSFRGADAGIATFLRQAWPTLRVLSLDESHRTSAPILAAGREVLGPDAACAHLRSVTGKDATMQWLCAPTAEREAAWIAERVEYLLGGTSHRQADRHSELAGCHLLSGSCSPGDIAILVRLKALMPPIKAALERRGIPCTTPEADAFWTDPRVLAILHGAEEFLTCQEAVVPPQIWEKGPSAVLPALLTSFHNESNRAVRSPDETLFDPLFASSPAFRQLLTAYQQHGGWRALLDFVALRQDLDLVRQKAEHVQIMTLHAAKGLEFQTVFLPCLEDGLLPFAGIDHLLNQGQPKHLQDTPTNAMTSEARCLLSEERRLLYVGLTRAAEAIFASCAAQRQLYGHELRLSPTPFLPFSFFQAIRLQHRTCISTSQLTLFS